MTYRFADRAPGNAVKLGIVRAKALNADIKALPAATRRWLRASGFKAKAGQLALLPGRGGRLAGAWAGADGDDHLWTLGDLPSRLPDGVYALATLLDARQATRAALGWALGCYEFSRYKKRKPQRARLVWPKGADRAYVRRTAEAIGLVRDLINTPAADLGPAELARAAQDLARRHGGRCRVIVGEALLRRNFPSIHAVGKGSARAPRLVDLAWGPPRAPKVTLVGKGVCFDSGGLDLKSSAGMKTMKKDMGGAAHALGLASMIMAAGLKVRLRVLIPAVENMVSGTSFRPLDVLATRKGLTVEVGNTDAEGRIVLSDALAEADAEKPDLIVDFATLTGAARVALGPDLPALFTPDDGLAADIDRHARQEADPLWRLPLWQDYRRGLDSKVADLNNISDNGFAGAIYAALFLQAFLSPGARWAHLDLFAWNGRARPGRPEGGEAMTLRALYALVAERYASSGT